mgnify:CR=1 FL=1
MTKKRLFGIEQGKNLISSIVKPTVNKVKDMGKNFKTDVLPLAKELPRDIAGLAMKPVSQKDKGQTPANGMKEGGMTMVKKAGKMVPNFAADGVGKMKDGGPVKSKMERRGYGAARQP